MHKQKIERNNKVIQLRGQGLSYASIAELMNISRARAHQICSGYNSAKVQEYKKRILKRDNYQCQWGYSCKNKPVEQKKLLIHHIDGDDRNNKDSNLITLCRSCHAAFHGSNCGDYKTYFCKTCGKEKFGKEMNLTSKNCKECSEKIIKGKEKYWSYIHKLFACKKCKNNNKKHYSDGLCELCWYQRRYNTNEKYKKEQKERTYKWRKNNPEKTKVIQLKAVKKWQKKNKLKASL